MTRLPVTSLVPGDVVSLRVGVIVPADLRLLAAVLAKDPGGGLLLVTKGAPEVVLDRCQDVPAAAWPALEALFSQGARVIAVASRPAGGTRPPLTAEDERGLTLEGFLAFADRPKADAGASIARLEQLGIRVKIITGDNGLVAARICTQIGVECTGGLTGAAHPASSATPPPAPELPGRTRPRTLKPGAATAAGRDLGPY